ncbi:hypothetical protein G6011_01975 [Alternaria panax]|uniref:Uncharacterized protein n=1 Tax=Alternaria panax TaxID=48097 RepID=A0AAD4I729_9PLEO|nr:hypothetical protein G6011_01975 [Alternaria panax]
MPNYARQSTLDLDEMYGNYIKNDNNVAIMRNIRTKEKMNSAHHCEDKECGGSPSMRCLSALHFCWCLAPIVDEDKKSDTYGQVVICGQRFQCISPKGCAKHPYLEGFNIDIRDARNGYPTTDIKWKPMFGAFKAEHDATFANDAEQQELSRKWEGTSEPQKQRQQKLQDQAAFQRRRKEERAAGRQDIDQEIGGLSWRGQDTSLARDGEIDDHRLTPLVYSVLSSTKATSTLETGAVTGLHLTTNSELPCAPIEDGEVADKQTSIETLTTRSRRKETKQTKREKANKMHAADPMAKSPSKVNRQKNPRGISTEEVIMSETNPRGRKGVKGSKTGIGGKTVSRKRTGGYRCI